MSLVVKCCQEPHGLSLATEYTRKDGDILILAFIALIEYLHKLHFQLEQIKGDKFTGGYIRMANGNQDSIASCVDVCCIKNKVISAPYKYHDDDSILT